MDRRKTIHLPKVTDFGAIFGTVALSRDDKPKDLARIDIRVPTLTGRTRKSYYVVSGYLPIHGNVGGYQTLNVTVRPEILAWIVNNVIEIEYDRISFQINVWDHGKSLVSVRHNKIIGDYWLAVINTDTIPRLCPVCGKLVSIKERTADGRIVGACGDAATLEQWQSDING